MKKIETTLLEKALEGQAEVNVALGRLMEIVDGINAQRKQPAPLTEEQRGGLERIISDFAQKRVVIHDGTEALASILLDIGARYHVTEQARDQRDITIRQQDQELKNALEQRDKVIAESKELSNRLARTIEDRAGVMEKLNRVKELLTRVSQGYKKYRDPFGTLHNGLNKILNAKR